MTSSVDIFSAVKRKKGEVETEKTLLSMCVSGGSWSQLSVIIFLKIQFKVSTFKSASKIPLPLFITTKHM